MTLNTLPPCHFPNFTNSNFQLFQKTHTHTQISTASRINKSKKEQQHVFIDFPLFASFRVSVFHPRVSLFYRFSYTNKRMRIFSNTFKQMILMSHGVVVTPSMWVWNLKENFFNAMNKSELKLFQSLTLRYQNKQIKQKQKETNKRKIELKWMRETSKLKVCVIHAYAYYSNKQRNKYSFYLTLIYIYNFDLAIKSFIGVGRVEDEQQ